jgi:hypothetical protein
LWRTFDQHGQQHRGKNKNVFKWLKDFWQKNIEFILLSLHRNNIKTYSSWGMKLNSQELSGIKIKKNEQSHL